MAATGEKAETRRDSQSYTDYAKKLAGHAADLAFEKAGHAADLAAGAYHSYKVYLPFSSKPHVMLSYNWTHQKEVKEVKAKLEAANYNVWMDIDQMKGDMNEKMAEAVEKSAVVCTFMSKKYKESDNCKHELNYAKDLHKPIIPILIEAGTKIDGWLGLVVAGKIYYDFSTPEKMTENFPKLLHDLGTRGHA